MSAWSKKAINHAWAIINKPLNRPNNMERRSHRFDNALCFFSQWINSCCLVLFISQSVCAGDALEQMHGVGMQHYSNHMISKRLPTLQNAFSPCRKHPMSNDGHMLPRHALY
jgi:hypothetical protein